MRKEQKVDKELFDLEKEQEETDDYHEVPPADIVAYNELRSCADLYRMYQEGQLDIQPDFQREIVWPNQMQTRFVDSLVKQLPIPSLCISLDYKTQERFVIDGLQRIASIVKFFEADKNEEWKLSKLDDIDERISGETNISIKEKNKNLFNRIQNTVLPVTVLRCDYSKRSHMAYLFTIFHRLNTGGSKLSNQEIRNCIYSGPFNNLLREIVRSKEYGLLLKPKKTDRFSNQEFVLRFLAFYTNLKKYNGQLSRFLNEFMEEYRNLEEDKINTFKDITFRTINLIYSRILSKASLPKLSKATVEALFVGVATNIGKLELESSALLKSRYKKLCQDELFSSDQLKEGLAQKEKVKKRLKRSIQIFS